MLLYLGTEKHRHCGLLTSGTQNLTTSGSVVTLQFHSDDDDDDDDRDDDDDDMRSVNSVERQQNRRQKRTYKGFWLRFEGSLILINQFIFTARQHSLLCRALYQL